MEVDKSYNRFAKHVLFQNGFHNGISKTSNSDVRLDQFKKPYATRNQLLELRVMEISFRMEWKQKKHGFGEYTLFN